MPVSSVSRSGPNVPASTSTIPDATSTSTTPASAVRSRSDAAAHGHRGAAHPAAAAGGSDRHAGRVRRSDEHRGDLLDGASGGTRPRRGGAPDRPAPSASPAATSRGWPPPWRRPRWWSGAMAASRSITRRPARRRRHRAGGRRGHAARSGGRPSSSGQCPEPSRSTAGVRPAACSAAHRATKSSICLADLVVVPAELPGEERGHGRRGGDGCGPVDSRARVRRLSTSSSVVAISWRAA